jgi:hypothetical protein
VSAQFVIVFGSSIASISFNVEALIRFYLQAESKFRVDKLNHKKVGKRTKKKKEKSLLDRSSQVNKLRKASHTFLWAPHASSCDVFGCKKRRTRRNKKCQSKEWLRVERGRTNKGKCRSSSANSFGTVRRLLCVSTRSS